MGAKGRTPTPLIEITRGVRDTFSANRVRLRANTFESITTLEHTNGREDLDR